MTLGEILKDYISVEKYDDGFSIFVADPRWGSNPHEIETLWVLVYEKKYDAGELRNLYIRGLREPGQEPYGFEKYGIHDGDICFGLEKVLDRKKFFKTCDDCGQRNHTFHMEGRICNSCIPEIPGRVY